MKKKSRKTPLLVVDDDRTIRKLLTRVAERAGFDVDSAKDGIEALEMMAKRSYEIAIVDLMMPRLSGYELVQKISALTPRPTVIVATALTNGDVASLDDSMVKRVIRKPFDIEAVAAALIETAQEIAEQRAAETSASQKPPVVVATTQEISAEKLPVAAKDSAALAKEATELAKEASVLAKKAAGLAKEASAANGKTATDEKPAKSEEPSTDKQSPPNQH